MSDKHIEKIFLYLLALSLLLHAGAFTAISLLPQEKKVLKKEPYMVELRDLPKPPPPVQKKEEKKIEPVKPRRQAKHPTRALPPAELSPPNAPPAAKPQQPRKAAETSKTTTPPAGIKEGITSEPKGEVLLKPKGTPLPSLSKLFPTQQKLARLEESYREKYKDVEQGDTRLIDTDDDVLAPYARRLKAAVQSRVDIISRTAGLYKAGVAVFYITIDRNGTLEEIKLIESTGNSIWDDVARRSLLTAGYVGPLPKKWPYEKLHIYYVFSLS